MFIKNTIQFDSTASRPKRGVVLVYDLQGFSRFFNQPDVQDYVPKFLNSVSRAMSVLIHGGDQFWLTNTTALQPLSTRPVHEKFLGDGALYVWTQDSKHKLSEGFSATLSNRLWNFKNSFHQFITFAAQDLPVLELPSAIRFGLAGGTVYELGQAGRRNKEYIGVCVNLASRLQKYCPELNFIASARIGLSAERLKKNGYIRVVATQIRGFPKEIVIVDRGELEALKQETREKYFSSIEDAF